MKLFSLKHKLFIISLIFLLIFVFNNCDQQNPVTPETINDVSKNQVTILKTIALNKPFKTEALISAAGGEITIGDEESGYCELDFPSKALSEDTYIGLYWQSENLLQMNCYPQGLTFNQPVEIELSYKDADLGGIDENNLAIYYYNPETAEWEFIGNDVDTEEKVVAGEITHFSRYAIGYDD